MKTKTSKGIHFTYTELLVITLAALAALLAAFLLGRHIGIDQTIKTASYYSDGEDERGAFYELEFLGGRVDRYYWEEEDKWYVTWSFLRGHVRLGNDRTTNHYRYITMGDISCHPRRQIIVRRMGI